eukprot:scaffold40659_cov38-Prasinocladus_malaysianus.AAC.1
MSWQDLKDMMREAGDVIHTEIMSQGGKSKGYGTVKFSNATDAANAIDTFNGTTYEGRILSLKLDKLSSNAVLYVTVGATASGMLSVLQLGHIRGMASLLMQLVDVYDVKVSEQQEANPLSRH